MPKRSSPSRFDLVPLTRALWWAALALLLVNDNLLKGRGIAPGWLTGKLSDFAFLIVAPVLFAALLPVALPRRRTLAVLSVVGLFVVTDLSQAASDAVVATVAHLGMTWRLWPDPTDLIALSVLPWTLRLLRTQRPVLPAAPISRALVWRGRVGAVAGAVACLATSAPDSHVHRPFFVNRTDAPVSIRVTWVLDKVDCTTTAEALAEALVPGDLDDPRTMTVASGEVAVLDGAPKADASPVGQCHLEETRSDEEQCVAAILETDDAPPVVMLALSRWRESDSGAMFSCSSPPPPLSKCKPQLDPADDPGQDAVALADSDRHLVFQGKHGTPGGDAGVGEGAGGYVRIADVDLAAIGMRASSPDACRSLREAGDALLANAACASDIECQVVRAPPIPGASGACGTYVNRSVSPAEIQSLNARWTENCIASQDFCPPAQPAACHDGTCGELCPGVSVPPCPPNCHNYDNLPDGICALSGQYCIDFAGEQCTCLGDQVRCKPFPRAAPGCPLGCLQEQPTIMSSGDAGAIRAMDAGYPHDAAAADGGGSAP